MKILITGSDGLVGKDILSAMDRDHEVMGIASSSLDLGDAERVSELMNKFKPVAVIHASGLSDVDYCENHPWEALQANVLSTHNLTLACLERGAALALISTHHVFNGTKRGPYTEWDVPDPQNVFGHSKCAAETLLREHMEKFFIFRTQGLFASRGDNFVLRVLRSVVENQPVRVPGDEYVLPTWSKDFADVVARIVRNKIYGTYHITNTGERAGITWADWARIILKAGGSPEHPVEAIPAQELNLAARRPARAILGNTIARLQGLSMRSYDEAIAAFFDELEGRVNEQARAPRQRKPGLVYGDPSSG